MDLSRKQLTSIDVIAEFPNVMHLDLSNNSVKLLSVLSDLPALVEINARYSETSTVIKLHLIDVATLPP